MNYDGPLNLSEEKKIGKITIGEITMNMEVSFEIKIEDLSSLRVDEYKWVLGIMKDFVAFFRFDLRISAQESKYHIGHLQSNGLGIHKKILESNPISFSNDWKKEFLEIILKSHSFMQI